jgi:hypothetical protein
MSKKLSIAAVCVGLLALAWSCALCASVQIQPGGEGEFVLWTVLSVGVTLVAVGVRGLRGEFNRR